jgi:hypothetical protein
LRLKKWKMYAVLRSQKNYELAFSDPSATYQASNMV